MKQFGLPALLSTAYVSVLFLLFSSDFGKENTFLIPDEAVDSTEAVALTPAPDATSEVEVKSRELLLPYEGDENLMALEVYPGLQSPEGASGN